MVAWFLAQWTRCLVEGVLTSVSGRQSGVGLGETGQGGGMGVGGRRACSGQAGARPGHPLSRLSRRGCMGGGELPVPGGENSIKQAASC